MIFQIPPGQRSKIPMTDKELTDEIVVA